MARDTDSTAEEADAALLDAHEGKPFWASQTVWSGLAVVGASAAGVWLAWRGRDMEGLAAAITALLAGMNAIVGRFRAELPLR
jgi:hypothetical protein